MSFNLSEEHKKLLIGTVAAVGVGTALFYLLTSDRSVHVLNDEKWQQQYLLSTHKLKELAKHMQNEMESGLKGKHSTLKMLPSYVSKPSGTEKGVYLALDLGGTNFRVIKVSIEGGIVGEGSKKQFTISEQVMTGTAEQLFDFIATCVQDFIRSENLENVRVLLGFTFSFPVNQTGISSGTLIQWTKGFTASGVEGHDVVQLLSEAFVRNNVNAHVAVLANDTVGTMVARSYSDTQCEMGVILGTGTNACYVESGKNITKLETVQKPMIINMEWGGFGDHTPYLPLSVEDKLIDAASVNPGKQNFEKMISGMYLGEIVRLFVISLIEREIITSIPVTALVHQHYKFETAFLTLIIRDESTELNGVQSLLSEKFRANASTVHDRRIIRKACELVATRAARLSAAAVVAVLEKIGRLNNTTVAVDGGVFEHLPGFKSTMDKTIKEMHPMSSVRLELTKDGSGNGAAIIASTIAHTL